MPSPLQKAANGLLELFSLKTLGQNPFMFGDTTMPVFEAGDAYGADLIASTTSGAVAVQLKGDNAFITVPAGEYWRLIAAHGQCDYTAASSAGVGASVVLAIRPQGTSPSVAAIGYAQTTVAGTAGIVAHASITRPVIMLPGMSLVGYLLTAQAAAGATMTVNAVYQRLATR